MLAAQQQANLFTSKHHVKISRQAMAQCVQDAQRMISDNKAVLAYGNGLEQAVKAIFQLPPANGR